MQPRAIIRKDPKNRSCFSTRFLAIGAAIQLGGGDVQVSNKAELVMLPSARPPTDVDSQTARALFSLRELLIRGEFAPGERMSELPLVARLKVSRTPIRLALERLAHMGLLDVSASGGFTVRGYTPTEALDAIEIRGVLEGTAARLAAERLVESGEAGALRHLAEEMTVSIASRSIRLPTTWISTRRFTRRSSIWRRARC